LSVLPIGHIEEALLSKLTAALSVLASIFYAVPEVTRDNVRHAHQPQLAGTHMSFSSENALHAGYIIGEAMRSLSPFESIHYVPKPFGSDQPLSFHPGPTQTRRV
jgi:hypothetical protein